MGPVCVIERGSTLLITATQAVSCRHHHTTVVRCENDDVSYEPRESDLRGACSSNFCCSKPQRETSLRLRTTVVSLYLRYLASCRLRIMTNLDRAVSQQSWYSQEHDVRRSLCCLARDYHCDRPNPLLFVVLASHVCGSLYRLSEVHNSSMTGLSAMAALGPTADTTDSARMHPWLYRSLIMTVDTHETHQFMLYRSRRVCSKWCTLCTIL